jgi:hypothetical protein
LKTIFETQESQYKEFMALIGYYSVTFAFLEDLMKVFINKMVNSGDNELGLCLTATMGFQPMYHSLMSLYRKREVSANLILGMEAILKQIKKLDEGRNKIVHSIWQLNKGNSTITRYRTIAKFAGGLQADNEELTLKDLTQRIDELTSAVESLLTMLDQWNRGHEKNEKET